MLAHNVETKERSDDRIIVLEPIEGQHVLSSTGLIDNRLFKGGNTLHGVREPQSNLWCFKYEVGGLPEPLKQKFTHFRPLLAYAEDYFKRRGLRIVKVID
jgi:hypothetical protein